MTKGLSTDTILIGIAIAWSLFLPFYPDTLFELLDGIVGVFLLLFVALLALPCGPVPGVIVLVAARWSARHVGGGVHADSWCDGVGKTGGVGRVNRLTSTYG